MFYAWECPVILCLQRYGHDVADGDSISRSGDDRRSAQLQGAIRKSRTRLLARTLFEALLTISATGLLAGHLAMAAPGDLDSSFNGNGKQTTKIFTGLDVASAVAIQPDGRIVVAGTSWSGTQYVFVVARYTIDGKLDPSFGNGGIVISSGVLGTANGMVLQPDGKIVVAGSGYVGNRGMFGLARFRPDGTPDPAFGASGIITQQVGDSDAQAYAVALAPDGRIVAAGYSKSGSNDIFAVARYNTDGTPDTTFHGTGWVTTPVGTLESIAQAVLVQPDGKVVAVGWGSSGPGAPFFALVRYNIDGTSDTGFGSLGIATSAVGASYAQAWGAALQPDGKILAGGDTYNSSGRFALARFNTNGTPDGTFGTGGYVVTPVQANANINAVVVQPNGKIVAAGSSGAQLTGNPWAFALIRYTANGVPDATFGSGGIVNTLIGGRGNDYITALALQHDGQIVAVGTSEYGPQQQAFALTRYVGDALPSATVVEFYNPDLDNYFVTADPSEQAFVDTGAVGRWQRTGFNFNAGGIALVCRFGGNIAVNPSTGTFFGPNSHFYTVSFDECMQLRSMYDINVKSWRFESYDFAITPTVGNGCAAGLVPVYRAYNNGFARGVDSNHRLTTAQAEYQKMIGKGWIGEGVTLCAKP